MNGQRKMEKDNDFFILKKAQTVINKKEVVFVYYNLLKLKNPKKKNKNSFKRNLDVYLIEHVISCVSLAAHEKAQ